jgi:hypothetical protein
MAHRLLHRQTGQPAFLPLRKSRWEIENRGFNDGKNRYGILIVWLLILLAMVIERLYRIRYLHRGEHGNSFRRGSAHFSLLDPGFPEPAC